MSPLFSFFNGNIYCPLSFKSNIYYFSETKYHMFDCSRRQIEENKTKTTTKLAKIN